MALTSDGGSKCLWGSGSLQAMRRGAGHQSWSVLALMSSPSPVNTWTNGKVRFSTWSLKLALPEAISSLTAALLNRNLGKILHKWLAGKSFNRWGLGVQV